MASPSDSRLALTYGDVLRELRRSRPDQLAAVDGPVRLTYPELDDRVNRLAGALAGAGFGEGDRLLWLGQNSFRILECLLAAAKLGGVLCPANWRQSPAELEFVVDDMEPSFVLWQEQELGETAVKVRDSDRSGAQWIQHDADEGAGGYEDFLATGSADDDERAVDPAAPLLALYTAAFEGRPNAALLSHTALVVQNLAIGHMQRVSPASVFLNSGPLFHIGTFMTTNATFHHGGTNVFTRRADAEEICRLVQAERCTHAFLMGPTIESIREISAGGAYDLMSLWPEDTEPRPGIITPPGSPWHERPGGFGQTEVTGLATFTAMGGSGRPLPTVQVRILDPDDREVPDGDVGEIAVRGATVMTEYHRRPELNARRSRNGWHHTNDLGRREPDGSIIFVGPNTTMIKSAAENIYPAEVEACITSHPGVREVCVIGVPDERWTQSVKAVVVPAEGAAPTAEEIIEHCRERIASYKKPRLVEFTDALPRTEAGFVDRAAVDEAFGGGGYPGAGS